jgi:lactoylglutathione lyase
MKLNHINLSVTEVMPTVSLLETYFGLRRSGGPCNDAMAFMQDDNDSLIALFKAREVTYPRMFHVGFVQESAEQVREIHARLKVDGFELPEPQENHGRLTFSFNAPGGFVIEVEAFLG